MWSPWKSTNAVRRTSDRPNSQFAIYNGQFAMFESANQQCSPTQKNARKRTRNRELVVWGVESPLWSKFIGSASRNPQSSNDPSVSATCPQSGCGEKRFETHSVRNHDQSIGLPYESNSSALGALVALNIRVGQEPGSRNTTGTGS